MDTQIFSQRAPIDWHALQEGDAFDTASRTITETDVVNFACLSGDFNRLHVDREYAEATPFGQRIAHGLLVLSVLSGLTTQSSAYRSLEPSILALKDIACRFPRPTFLGDTIRVRVSVQSKHDAGKPDRGEVLFRREAINQRDEVVVQADFRMLLKKGAAV